MDRMYLPRNEGYRGLIQLETAHKTATIRLDTCFNTKNDPLLVIAKEHQKNKKRTKKKYSVPSQATMLKESSTSLKHWNLRTKLQLSMPEKLNRKQSSMPKIN